MQKIWHEIRYINFGGFKKGVGVSAALLRRNNIKVLSSFDERDIDIFLKSVVSGYHSGCRNLQNLSEMPKFCDLLKESEL